MNQQSDSAVKPSANVGKTSNPTTAGLWYGVAAYLLWGIMPIYFQLLLPATPFEIVAFRIIWSLVFCLILLTVTRAWRAFFGLFRRPRIIGIFAIAGALIYVNWSVYVYASLNGDVLQAALGYFLNPIFSVLLGVFLLHERLTKAQWVTVALAVVAAIVLTFDYGQVPWISLALAASFALYGYVKNRTGGSITALQGLTLETMGLTPVALIQLIIVNTMVGVSFGSAGAVHLWLMIASGVITAVPLLLFAAAARRLPLSTVGFLQFISPIMQFIFGVFVLNEPMSAARWAGFAIIWVALVILMLDSVRNRGNSRLPAKSVNNMADLPK